MENQNHREYLEKIKAAVIDNLRQTAPVPSVQMQDVPRNPFPGVMTEEEEAELEDLVHAFTPTRNYTRLTEEWGWFPADKISPVHLHVRTSDLSHTVPALMQLADRDGILRVPDERYR